MEFLALFTVVASVVLTIVWLVIGWRVMVAHERIADALSEWKYQMREQRKEQIRQSQPDPPQYQGWRPRSQSDDW